MPGIFDIGDVPAWMNPVRGMMERGEKDAQNFSSNFSQAFGQASSQAFQKQQVQDKRNFAMQQQQQLAKKLAPIAGALAGTQTPEQSWDVVSKNPTWMADPQTGPFVEKFLKTQTDVAKAQSATVAGKIAIDAGKQFYDELNKIPAMQANIIRGMGDPSNPTAPPNANQLAALNATKNTLNQQAKIDLLARGQTEISTRFNSKGEESETYSTPKPNTANTPVGDWNLKTVTVDGRDIHYLQGPKGGIRMIDTKTGQSVEPTFKDYKDLAKAPAGDVDKELKQIATDKVKAMIKGEKPTTAKSATKNEVIRTTPDGRKAIFDSQSKKFLRYAD